MPPENDTDRQTRDPSAEHALSERSAIEGWAEDAGKRPVVAATHRGSLSLDLVSEEDANRAVDWDTFFTLYDSADVALLVDRRSDSHRFVDDERIREDGRAESPTRGGRSSQ